MERAGGAVWLWVRWLTLAGAAIAGPLMYNEMHLEFENQIPTWSFIGAVLGFSAIGVLVTLAGQVINPWASEIWSKPSWNANPFNMRQPIQVFHLSGWFFFVVGISAALYTIAIGARNFMFVLPLAVGVGAAIGVKLAVLVFASKFNKGGNAA